MRAEVKTKWVEALRDPSRYTQTFGRLRRLVEVVPERPQGFCCLGVLCDIYGQETGTEWGEEGEFLGRTGALPDEVISWAGLPDEGAINSVSLTTLNDGNLPWRKPQTFFEIADLIEEHL